MAISTEVIGFCPACGYAELHMVEGAIFCRHHPCPRPEAAALILADEETEHVVIFRAEDFTVRHPLRERLDDALMQCRIHAAIAELDGPPDDVLGRYRVRLAGAGRLLLEPFAASTGPTQPAGQ